MLKWTVAALTDRGAKRADNQDNFLVSDDNRVFVVADGMGGALGGATASRLTVESIGKFWEQAPVDLSDDEAIHEWLVEAVNIANENVFAYSTEHPSVRGMGTTVVVAVQTDSRKIHIAHVGDSRAYLVREGRATLLTQDHSLVMELFKNGQINEQQMKDSPFKSYITRCVGHRNKLEVDQAPRELQPGDWIILCTDGLTAVLHDEQIGEVIESITEPTSACNELVRLTLEGGAPDNVTVLAIRYHGEIASSDD